MKTTPLFALLLSLAGPVAAACPEDDGFRKLASFERLYLGETHGTAEVPQLVQCLVEKAIAAQPDRLAVSLEMPEEARRPDSLFWKNQDGRASQAMWRLHQWLLTQQTAGTLKLDYHQPTTHYPNQADYEKAGGQALNALMRKHARVIVLGGSFHSRREAFDWMPGVAPMGSYVGEGTVHVEVHARQGGSAWQCRSTAPAGSSPPPPICAEHAVPPLPLPPGDAGDLRDGRKLGHDYVYLLKSFMASPPHQPQ
ncbi:hypothetical protein [Roseateles sp. LYH14W]|uniref:Haem-binding uptake Tiki superfamily ChaN domain-containing protein n=1 Tax=Pelomonas parva TaxID=3299032 RepID=A0ABW7EXC5_9BURK